MNFDYETLCKAEIILSGMREKNMKLATAESCTGGLISAAFTAVPGSSDVFERGFVTYSNEAKHDMLGVPSELIAELGAASHEVAEKMAIGAIQNSKADVAVSVTGIAGPAGGSSEKPVGLVYIGLARRNGASTSHKFNFSGDRTEIRMHTLKEAMDILYDKIS